MEVVRLKYSESLENFLGYLREVQQEYNIAGLTEQEANNATQDILHNLELCDNKYHDCAKLSLALRAVRQERRAAKDTQQILQPVISWIGQNAKTIKSLEQLLGAVRKAEKNIDCRHYNPKTDIIDKTFEGRGLLD